MFPLLFTYNILKSILILTMSVLFFLRRRPKNFPPGPISWPVFGNLHELGLEPHRTLQELGKDYGNIFALDLGSFRCVVLNDNKSIKKAFSMEEFSGRPKLKTFVDRSAGHNRGLGLSSGRTWVEQRRFTLETLRDLKFGTKSMEGIIQEEIKEFIPFLKSKIGQPLSTKSIFYGPVVNSLWQITTGERYDYNDPHFKTIITVFSGSLFNAGSLAGVSNFFPLFARFFPNWSGYNHFMKAFKSADQIIKTGLQRRQSRLQNGEPTDFVDAYLSKIANEKDPESSFFGTVGESNLNFTLQDLFLGGTETTSAALAWAFFFLAHNPIDQDKLYSEILSVVGPSRIPELADRKIMPYTQAVLMEILRFSTINPLLPHSTTQDVKFEGYLIPKDTVVIANFYAASFDENLWEDPYAFRPARFITSKGRLNQNTESVIVFSAGKRHCPGAKLAKDELFLFLAALFQKFKVSFDQSRPVPHLHEAAVGASNTPKEHYVILEAR